jgi:hypothetical protein
MPAGTTRGIWHAVYARPGQLLLAHVLLESGAHWCGLPLQYLSTEPKIPVTPVIDAEPWGAMGEHIEAVHIHYLEGLPVRSSGRAAAFSGRHTGIVIDWADGFSRYPAEHKPLNLIADATGGFRLLPNNYCLFTDRHFTRPSTDTRLYRRGDTVYWEP